MESVISVKPITLKRPACSTLTIFLFNPLGSCACVYLRMEYLTYP